MASSRQIPERERWNHNIHYFDVLLDSIPVGAGTALDVGCGDGVLTRRLRTKVDRAIGIDLSAEQIALAQSETHNAGVEFVTGDVMTHDFGEQFDAVVSVATLHHLPTREALQRLADLVAPGGVLAIEGLARSTRPSDFGHDAVGAVLTQVLKRTGGRRYYEHSAPIVWPPPDSHTSLRRVANDVLPGVRYQRHPLWRYTLVWNKPAC
jgi:2-polyprenyl-3-methyl-5-hydroxy-6-metoxy-1,4-benzoquinol methylase